MGYCEVLCFVFPCFSVLYCVFVFFVKWFVLFCGFFFFFFGV